MKLRLSVKTDEEVKRLLRRFYNLKYYPETHRPNRQDTDSNVTIGQVFKDEPIKPESFIRNNLAYLDFPLWLRFSVKTDEEVKRILRRHYNLKTRPERYKTNEEDSKYNVILTQVFQPESINALSFTKKNLPYLDFPLWLPKPNSTFIATISTTLYLQRYSNPFNRLKARCLIAAVWLLGSLAVNTPVFDTVVSPSCLIENTYFCTKNLGFSTQKTILIKGGEFKRAASPKPSLLL
ncbi:hypothetical protein KEJ18_04690 [Candidatus Bathyarchaeota archaeon]|nr:hypothetical protein [Candidatus Bathyarchaeota archaeon]